MRKSRHGILFVIISLLFVVGLFYIVSWNQGNNEKLLSQIKNLQDENNQLKSQVSSLQSSVDSLNDQIKIIKSIRLNFSSSPCDKSIDPYDRSNFGIKQTEWLDSSTLHVKVNLVHNCAVSVRNGDYEIQGNKIILKYNFSEIGGDVVTSCDCISEVVYRFTGIEKKDYEFQLGG